MNYLTNNKWTCPACGLSLKGGLAAPCKCNREGIDNALKVGATWDWITPAAELAGISPSCLFVVMLMVGAILALISLTQIGG